MKKIDLKKAGNITLLVLQEISQFLDEVVEPLTLSGMKRRQKLGWTPKRVSDNLLSLDRRGYIKINRAADSIELTNKGKIKLIENSLDNKIDGKWRMLSWDIPEDVKIKRQQFCRSIRRIGYKQVQKSLWACPYIRADEVDLIIKEYGISKYVAYLRVDETDIESHLKQLFEIK
ncbi:MAG: hypothetical protein NTY30_03340 [Candidatus Berkelbacteria bacterium]|nr:hypothetical protein [Candidatus Berkelbacteria bacterium]